MLVLIGAFGVGLIGCAVLFTFFRSKAAWWEYGIAVAIPVIVALFAKLLIHYADAKTQELWGGHVLMATYQEPYREWVTHTRQHCTGSGEDRICWTETYRTCDHFGPRWYAEDNNGIGFSISRETWERLARQFANKEHQRVRRDYCRDAVGGRWVTTFQGNDEALEPVISLHHYDNPVVVSSSNLRLPKPSADEIAMFKPFEYPEVRSSIRLGYDAAQFVLSQANGIPDARQANEALIFHAAKWGRTKQQIIYVLVFQGQPLEASHVQEALWQRGNKNEMVICIGVDGANKVQWTRIFSWMLDANLHVAIRSAVMKHRDQEIRLLPIVEEACALSLKMWERREFAEFNYLDYQPPLWATILVFVISILVCAGVVVFAVKNPYNADGTSRRYRRRPRYY